MFFALGLYLGPKQPQHGPRWFRDGPTWPQDGPTWPQDGAKLAPRWRQVGPRKPQDGPKFAYKIYKKNNVCQCIRVLAVLPAHVVPAGGLIKTLLRTDKNL